MKKKNSVKPMVIIENYGWYGKPAAGQIWNNHRAQQLA
jgi:hypothetical protein